jgi:hypothetical protein
VTPTQLKRLRAYARCTGDDSPLHDQDQRARDIAAEMEAIRKAPSADEAYKVIEWWGDPDGDLKAVARNLWRALRRQK